MNSHTSPLSDLVEAPPRFARFSQFLADKDRVTRLALLVTAGSLLVNVLTLSLLFYYSRKDAIFVVLDSEANVIPITGAKFSDARELHVKEAMLATTALLSRNPKGFDQPEFVEALFSKTALAAATRVKDAEAREFAERQMQQKPQISRIDAIANQRNEVQVQVTGEVSRWGFVQQAPFSDSIPFTLRLVLRNNLDLLRQRQQPLVVESFQLTYANSNR